MNFETYDSDNQYYDFEDFDFEDPDFDDSDFDDSDFDDSDFEDSDFDVSNFDEPNLDTLILRLRSLILRIPNSWTLIQVSIDIERGGILSEEIPKVELIHFSTTS